MNADEATAGDSQEAGQGAPRRMAPTLDFPLLLGLGLGATVGVFVLTGTGHLVANAGTDVFLIYLAAGLIAFCGALSLADLASRYPSAGGAFSYCRQSLGRFIGNLVGWCLILEFTVFPAALTRDWVKFIFPCWTDVQVSLIAAMVSFCGFLLLLSGTRTLVRLVSGLAIVQVLAILLLIAGGLIGLATAAGAPGPASIAGAATMACSPVDAAPPVFPFAAMVAILFAGLTGYEVVAMAGEDARSPRRAVARAILACFLIVFLLYLAATAVSLLAIDSWGSQAAALRGEQLAAVLVGDSFGAILFAVMQFALAAMFLAFSYAQVRLYLAMSRQQLLPRWLGQVSSSGTPVRLTLLCGLITAALAGFGPSVDLLNLTNATVPLIFAAVALSMLVSRWRGSGEEEVPPEHVFWMPLPWLVGSIAILGCGFVLYNYPYVPFEYLAGWLAAAVVASVIAYFRGEPLSALDPVQDMAEETAEGWLDQL